ncbi:MAG: DUF885 domain-containing protein, partial [Candidatus Hodarchaeota archaeon]
HEKYDNILPNGSDNDREEMIVELIGAKMELEKEIDYNALLEEGKLNYDLIKHLLELELFRMNEIATWRSGTENAAGPISTIGDAIYLLYVREFAPLETRVKSIIERLKASPQYLEESKTTWQFPVKLWTDLAIDEAPRTISFLQYILQTLQPKITDGLYQELETAVNNTIEAFRNYAKWIKKEMSPKAKFPWSIGTQKFSRLILLRKLGKTPEEILKIGEKALLDTKNQLKDLAKELYPDKTVEEVREIIKNDHPPTFEMVLEHVRELANTTRTFIQEHNIMDVPKRENLKVVPTPSFLIPVIPFAAYMSPEKFSNDQTGHYLVTPIEERKEMLKEHSYAACKNTAVHEGYPGHHLQLTAANLQPNLIRSLGQGDESVEGWAHYCEQLMAEKGFLGKKEVFSQLIDQLWRAVRIIVDVKLHTGQMTFDEAKEFMIQEIGMDENAVVSELSWYTAQPGYPLSYLLGKLLLLEVRDHVKEKLGEKFTDQFFHNTFLESGGMPIHFLKRFFAIKMSEIK